MKGIIFNLLEELVRREHGEDAWDSVLESTGVDGSYTSLGSYPDQEFFRLVTSASTMLKESPETVTRWFGRRAIPILARKYPEMFVAHRASRSFLLSINDVIHAEVRKVYPGVDLPVFDYDTSTDGVLLMGYRSGRKLCALAEGFIQGAADHYHEAIQVTQPQCMLRGDEKCVLRVAFKGPNGAGPGSI